MDVVRVEFDCDGWIPSYDLTYSQCLFLLSRFQAAFQAYFKLFDVCVLIKLI